MTKETKIQSITKFVWAIVGAIASVLAVIFMLKKSDNADIILENDDELADQADDIQTEIDELKTEIDNIDTSDMSDSDVSRYFNKDK